jgi:hypothetical protein
VVSYREKLNKQHRYDPDGGIRALRTTAPRTSRRDWGQRAATSASKNNRTIFGPQEAEKRGTEEPLQSNRQLSSHQFTTNQSTESITETTTTMLGALRRVISGEDVAERAHQEERYPEDVTMPETPREMASNNNQSTAHHAAGPAIVENDHDMETMDEKFSSMEEIPDSKNIYTPGSSLSDMSEGHQHEEQDTTGGNQQMNIDDHMMHDRSSIIQEQAVATFVRGKLSRHDSRASDSSGSVTRANSQTNSLTGSRDWGWFEDVHVSEHLATPYLKRKETTEDKTNQKKGKKGRALPHGTGTGSEGTPSEGLREIVRSSSLDNGRLTCMSLFCRSSRMLLFVRAFSSCMLKMTPWFWRMMSPIDEIWTGALPSVWLLQLRYPISRTFPFHQHKKKNLFPRCYKREWVNIRSIRC